MQNKSIGSQSQCSNIQSDLTFKDYYPKCVGETSRKRNTSQILRRRLIKKLKNQTQPKSDFLQCKKHILNKLFELTEQINSGLSSQAPPHVIAVTETWLNASVPDSCLTIPSFSQVFRTDRSSLSVFLMAMTTAVEVEYSLSKRASSADAETIYNVGPKVFELS